MLNKEEKNFGHVLNGLCHIAFGLAHKIPSGKLPKITVKFASASEIYNFRQAAHSLHIKNKSSTFYSDFVSAMNSVMEFEKHVEYIKQISEKDLTYLGVCFCANQNLTDALTSSCNVGSTLRGYKSYSPALSENTQFDFAPGEKPADQKPDVRKKMVISLHPKESISTLLNPMITAAIEVGRTTPRKLLYLMPWVDKDDNEHFNISLHPFPILMASSLTKQQELVDELKRGASPFYSHVNTDSSGNPLAICAFGDLDPLSALFGKTRCGLWRKGVTEKDFVDQSVISSEEQKKAESKGEYKESKSDLNKQKAFSIQAQSGKMFPPLSKEGLLKKIENEKNKMAQLARKTPWSSDFKKKLDNGIASVQEWTTKNSSLLSKESLIDYISEIFSEAVGGGQQATVQYLLESQKDHINREDITHAIEYAKCNGYNELAEILDKYSRELQASSLSMSS